MSLKTRIEKLEDKMGVNAPEKKPLHIALIGLRPDNYDDSKIIGYRCSEEGDLTVMREPRESADDCLSRCQSLAPWDDGGFMMLSFDEIIEDELETTA